VKDLLNLILIVPRTQANCKEPLVILETNNKEWKDNQSNISVVELKECRFEFDPRR